ncbi:MAG: hypothetical protein LR017_02750 [Candidatus Pacebacteria bacterium]|jgi:hypothetical protein|nr:hypothetical protein [Candidatus Paceibacterota bacterium]
MERFEQQPSTPSVDAHSEKMKSSVHEVPVDEIDTQIALMRAWATEENLEFNSDEALVDAWIAADLAEKYREYVALRHDTTIDLGDAEAVSRLLHKTEHQDISSEFREKLLKRLERRNKTLH